MIKREAAIVTAYTGILIGAFSDFHQYAEEVMERPIWTHEFADKDVWNELREKSRQDFISMKVEDEDVTNSTTADTV
jgi:hypothetical protein